MRQNAMRKWVQPIRRQAETNIWLLVVVICLALSSCGATALEAGPVTPEPDRSIALPTVTLTSKPNTTFAATPNPTASPLATPILTELLILHSNDNWGETEPCG
jgi:hypothetical protein